MHRLSKMSVVLRIRDIRLPRISGGSRSGMLRWISMSKLLFLLIGVVVFSKTNGTPKTRQASLIPEESEDEFSVDDWSELDGIYPGDPYTEGLHVPEKRGSRDSLMRRSTLDKNFMRFGRSGFFPGERCCRQKDLVGLAESYASISDPISLTKRETDSNFIRFGRGGTDNFMRFGKGGDNFMRFGKGGDNFMRFGRPEKDKGNFMRFGRGGNDNFMRFGKGGDNFMRFGRPEKDKGNFMRFGKDDKGNFMRFGKDDKGNFMRFGKDDKGNFMRFGRGKDDNFMRFGRGDKDNFIRFGRGDDNTHNPEETDDEDDVEDNDTFTRPAKSDNFIRFGKNPNFIRYGKSGGKDDSFIRFGKSGRNGTNFLRFGRELGEDSDGDDGTKTNLTTRRKRMTTEGESPYNRKARSPELMEDVLPETKRSAIDESVTKPNLLKFISLINRNHPNWGGNDVKSFLPSVQRNPVLKPNTETYKRKQDGSGFIRFG